METAPRPKSRDWHVNGQSKYDEFAANCAAFARLLNEGESAAAESFSRIAPESIETFVAANKLEFHFAGLALESPLRLAIGQALAGGYDGYAERQRDRQESLLDELWFLAERLEGAAIPFVLLKGLYFADVFYGGLERRFSWDLDVLVKAADAARVDRLLRRSGYFRRSAVLGSRALAARFTHAFDYGNARPRFSVDLHWMLSRHPSFRVDEAAIWSNLRSCTLLDRRFAVLSIEYEIVSNVLSTFRDIQRGAIRLRALVDLYKVLEIADASIDWGGFLDRRRAERIGLISVNVLSLLLDLFDCRKRFSGAARLVDSVPEMLVPYPGGLAANLFEPGGASLKNRGWTAGAYECSRTSVAAWWMVSLPFRLAVYRSGRRYANFKRRIHVIKNRLRGAEPVPVARRRR